MATCEKALYLEELWNAYKTQNDLDSREELILEYLGLVKYIAGRIAISLPPGVDSDDLFSYGVIGLIDAIEKFDLSREVKFESYASIRIRGSIFEGMRAQDWAPRSLRRQAKELERAISSLSGKLGRMPTDEEISQEMGLEPEKLDELFYRLNSATLFSIDQPFDDYENDKNISLIDTIPDDSGRQPEANLDYTLLLETLASAIEALSEREQLVISLYYHEELTLKEISKVLGVTESRVSQIHTKAIFRLRGFLNVS